ncbi:MAG: LpxD N-terminal domain-containing protein, partial [Acidobacteriota bacterium]
MSLVYSVDELAARLGAEVVGVGDRKITGVAPLDRAGVDHLSFLHNPKYVDQARSSSAGVILVVDAGLLPGRDLLVCPEPYLALARALELVHPVERPEPGVHPSAVVAPSVEVGAGASVGPLAVVGEGSHVGERSVVGSGSVLGRGVVIGADCLLHPRVVIEDRCRVGDRCILHSGV